MTRTIDHDTTRERPKTDAHRRLRGFAIHMILYGGVMVACVMVNVLMTPGAWWFPFPLVLWGAPLALHAAYVMGLIRPYKKSADE